MPLAGWENAVSHRASRIPLGHCSRLRGFAPGDIHLAREAAADDELFRVPAGDHRGAGGEVRGGVSDGQGLDLVDAGYSN